MLARVHRWQLLIAVLGALLLIGLIGAASFNYATVLIPTYGGVYREGIAGAPRYLNPLLSPFNLVDQDINALIYRGLARFDERGRVVPDLAEGWEISPDARVYTVRLRPGLRWQDGVPITVDDVLFTFETLQDPEFPGDPYIGAFWQSVIIERVDDLTVRFTLAEPFAPFLDELTTGILPAHVWQGVSPRLMPESQLNFRPVGSGPFQVTALDAISMTLKPNVYYPGPRPYLEAVNFRFYPDDMAVVEAYRRGEVDALGRILPQTLPEVESLPDLNLFFSPMPGYTIILLNFQNPNVPFFKDRRLRQALLYALDREAIVTEYLRGMGIVAHSPILPDTWAYAADVTRYEYNPDQARALLEKAGWVDRDGDGVREKNGQVLRFSLYGDDDPVRAAILNAVAEYWRAVGVEAVPQPVTFAGLVGDFLEPRAFEAALVFWRLYGDPDPYPLWHSSQAKNGQNYAGWDNLRADELMEEARRTPDPNRRIQLYREFQQLFAEEVPGILLYHPMYAFGVRNTVKNVTVGPLHRPGDRYRTLASWYMRLRRVPITAVTPTPTR